MTMSTAWRELYRAALLELRSEELRPRIDEAEKTIQARIIELRQEDSNSGEEARELEDALRGLRVLAATECQASREPISGTVPRQAAS
jgi:hypothetical protein